MKIKDLKLPELTYSYSALVPVISEVTMLTHHTKHHQAYLNKLLECIQVEPSLGEKELQDVLSHLEEISESIRQKVRNNGGGFYNHKLFWEFLTDKKITPSENLLSIFSKDFVSFEEFKQKIVNAGLGVFGSGWVWVLKTPQGLTITTTPNQDNPLMSIVSEKLEIVLAIDVWEHAYYLDHKQDRQKYLENIFEVLDYKKIEELILKK
ncbi:superoxide dismutase [Patescibacteria group bacterium]|nr:superoxide dismutase [Patescibacteria group bacterium]